MRTAIKVQQLSKTFTSAGKKVHALDGVSWMFMKEVLESGPNGAGKTTFLNTLTLLVPDAAQSKSSV